MSARRTHIGPGRPTPRLTRLRRRLAGERGFSLIELLVAMVIAIPVVTATFYALEQGTRAQLRDQSFADEVTSTQVSVARMLRDIRQATTLLDAQPNRIEFLMPQWQTVNGVTSQITLDVRYVCTVADSRAGYTRCARTQATSGNLLPSPSASAGPADIQHVINGPISQYCKADGSGPSGSVFFYSNANTANTDSSPPACDENYENLVAQRPDYVQVLIRVPASGSQTSGGLTHQTVLNGGAYLRNWNLGA